MIKKKVSVQESILWNSAGSIVYLLTQWLITVFVVRLAGVSAAGDFTLAMSVNNIFYSIAMQGIRNYQVSDVKGKYKDGTYICSRIMACVFSFIICTFYCIIIGYNAEQKICIMVYCLFKMAEALYDVYAGVCQKYWRMDYIGKSWMIKGVLTFVGFLITLYLFKNLTLAILCMVVVSFGVIVFYDVPRTRKLADISMVWQDKNNILLIKECLPLLGYIVLSTAFPTIPRLFLERALGSYALGIYGSVSTPTLIVQMGATYIFSPFMTLFAEQYNDNAEEAFKSNLKKCFIAIGLLGIVSLAGGKILGKWGLNLLYGKEVAEYVSLLLPLIFCTILTAFVWMLCGLLTVTRNFKGLLISNGTALIVSLLISGILIKLFDIQGTSLALGISLLVEMIGLYVFLSKDLKKQFK